MSDYRCFTSLAGIATVARACRSQEENIIIAESLVLLWSSRSGVSIGRHRPADVCCQEAFNLRALVRVWEVWVFYRVACSILSSTTSFYMSSWSISLCKRKSIVSIEGTWSVPTGEVRAIPCFSAFSRALVARGKQLILLAACDCRIRLTIFSPGCIFENRITKRDPVALGGICIQ